MGNRHLLSLILFSLLFSFGSATADTKEMKFGAIFMMSGEGSSWGVNARRGTELAVSEINAQGGIKGHRISVVYEDSPGGKAEKAVSAYQKLKAVDQISILLGPIAQDELEAIGPLLKRDDIFAVSTTTSNKLPENVLSVWMDPPTEAARMAEFVRKQHKKVAVLSSQQSWEHTIADSFRKEFEKLGGDVLVYEEPSQDSTDVKVQALRVKKAEPEAVFVSSYFLLPKYLRELKRLQVNVPLYSAELDQSVIDSAAGAAEGLIFISPVSPESSFVKIFKQKFNDDPDLPAAQFYDGVHLLAEALKTGAKSATELKSHFSKFAGYSGASGQISIESGRTVMNTEMFSVENGKIKKLS